MRVVVAGAEVHVAAQRRLAGLHDAPHDQHHLRVALVANHAVHDMRADGFELRRPVDVGFLVEAREQFDDDGHLPLRAASISASISGESVPVR